MLTEDAGVAFCTSPKSVALFRQLGFERWGGQAYATYEHEPGGRRWFASLQGELAVMVKRL